VREKRKTQTKKYHCIHIKGTFVTSMYYLYLNYNKSHVHRNQYSFRGYILGFNQQFISILFNYDVNTSGSNICICLSVFFVHFRLVKFVLNKKKTFAYNIFETWWKYRYILWNYKQTKTRNEQNTKNYKDRNDNARNQLAWYRSTIFSLNYWYLLCHFFK